MQRLKKPFIWLVLVSLITVLIPSGLVPTANAANGTTYFSPDIMGIRDTANIDIDTLAQPGQALRDSVYVTNSNTLSISGTYSKVSGDSLKARIDLLVWDVTNSKWKEDNLHTAPGTVQKDPTNQNRFNANNLTLFPGLNRITFSGKFGNAEGSETFYVLYDKVPYVTKLVVSGTGLLTDINLNEGSRVVVKNSRVSLMGEVFNTTKATVSVNGGTELSTNVYNNQLATPPLTLTPGLNKVKITFSNSSDSIEIFRDIYYFTDQNPFIGLYVQDASDQEYDILNNAPSIKDTDQTTAVLTAQFLIPYNSDPFSSANLAVTVDGNAVGYTLLAPNLYSTTGNFQQIDSTEEVIIEDATGPAYRLITLKTDAYDLTKDTANPTETAKTQTPKIEVEYTYPSAGTAPYTASIQPKFFLSDDVAIKSIKYLPDYPDTNTSGDITNVSQVNLSGAQLNSNSFYIMVETNNPTTKWETLKGTYMPLGSANLDISNDAPIQAQKDDGNGNLTPIPNTYIYKITNFANGQQTVQFKFDNSTPYTVQISYASKSYINVDNLVDGQTYPYNSANQSVQSFLITGEYIGFTNIESAQYFVNGIDGSTLTNTQGADTDLDVTLSNPTFKLDLNISTSGPLVTGENRIEFRGVSLDAAGNKQVVSKMIRFYIIDENVATVTEFKPGKVPAFGQSRVEFPLWADFSINPRTQATEEAIRKILELPTEFTYQDEKFTTSEQEYDLVVRGNGARIVNLYQGSEKIVTIEIPRQGDNPNYVEGLKQDSSYYYNIIGNEKDFIIRFRDFKFEAPGTHVYNIEMINNFGARTSQRLEITREVAPYRLLAPQPTVGGQYIVNKNFVRFDVEAEGATQVIIGKEAAVRRTEPDMSNRFTMDYVGLKPDKENKIKIQIVRGDTTLTDEISVYYTGAVTIDSQYMAEKPASKYSVFNKKLELSFPKGTVMQSSVMNNDRITKFYPDTKLLFGIADPKDGVVERRNDYGVLIGNNSEINNGYHIPAIYPIRFAAKDDTYNFIRVSDIYWISGGVGELGDKGETGYKPATNGLAPYSNEGIFTAFEKEREVVPSQRGTLKLSYDASVVDEAGSLVTVFRFVDMGGYGKWEPVPGEVNTKAHTITVPFDKFGYYTVMKLSRSYMDITNHPWAKNILNGLYSKGIMQPLRTDAFGADDQTTRGEFATLLVKGLSIPINADESQQTFFDVQYGTKTATWDFDHLETAARAGIITGRTEGFFYPNMPITREEAAVMIARAMKSSLKLPANDQKLKDSLAKSFLDAGKMDYYALPSIQAVTKAKIMSGSPVTLPGAKKASYNFNPDSNMTRAEAGKIAVELLKKSTGIFPKNFS
ncbi:S-layer homology domain-containing protein [Paenibacillus barengoltzii]|uniref:S-layer homology domain-containing protein n=1 Tax=Paenibacillus barengoltzii TaxID=343517 RepID=UPI003F8874CD